MRPLSIKTTSESAARATSASPTQHYSTWHSPVPYLFGGLAALLGLIAFALLILACSYWRLSGGGEGRNGEDEKQRGPNEKPMKREVEEKVLVIMAGDDAPTFLATPAMSKGLGLEGKSGKSENVGVVKMENGEKVLENSEERERSGVETH